MSSVQWNTIWQHAVRDNVQNAARNMHPSKILQRLLSKTWSEVPSFWISHCGCYTAILHMKADWGE